MIYTLYVNIIINVLVFITLPPKKNARVRTKMLFKMSHPM